MEFPTLSGCGEAHPCCFVYSPGLGSRVLDRDLNKYDLGTIRISSLFVAFKVTHQYQGTKPRRVQKTTRMSLPATREGGKLQGTCTHKWGSPQLSRSRKGDPRSRSCLMYTLSDRDQLRRFPKLCPMTHHDPPALRNDPHTTYLHDSSVTVVFLNSHVMTSPAVVHDLARLCQLSIGYT